MLMLMLMLGPCRTAWVRIGSPFALNCVVVGRWV